MLHRAARPNAGRAFLLFDIFSLLVLAATAAATSAPKPASPPNGAAESTGYSIAVIARAVAAQVEFESKGLKPRDRSLYRLNVWVNQALSSYASTEFANFYSPTALATTTSASANHHGASCPRCSAAG
jgi:hypothetical protein